MATQMAYYPSANGINQSPFQSRHAGGAANGPAGVPNNPFAAGQPRVPPTGDPVRPAIPPGRHMFHPFNRPYPKPGQDRSDYDSKQLRKSSMRKTVDYYSSVIRMLETRVWQRDHRDRRALQPDVCYYPELVPPSCYLDMPSNAITTRFTKVATNKIRCPVFCLTWTPEGRRLITGASSGEFTLWNGLTFNFETILQAHDSPVRSMVWSHNDIWMVTGDHGGYIKYWQSNMNNVKMFQAHKEPIRGISFSPTDQKLASCSDDGTVRIWDFVRCQEEKILRGHGADVKCVDWHPQKSLVISGSKDNQQPVKLWDPKSGQSLATLHAHKSTVMDAKWNKNGQWLLTASRDHLIKLFDIRRLDQELQTFRGHKKEASCLSWHPFHEELFCSGGSDGAIFFWNVGADKEVGAIDQAHESLIWALAWHPIGHILCSGSNDHTSKFWTRNRPGDKMRDKYNLNTLPPGVMPEDAELLDDHHAPNIPGMGPEDKVDVDGAEKQQETSTALAAGVIPGLDVEPAAQEAKPTKKVPYAKPIPRNFQAQWNESPAKKPPILPTPSREHPPGISSDEEDGDRTDEDFDTEGNQRKNSKSEERNKTEGKTSDSFNRDRELDDDESYPRSGTPNLDDAPGYARGPPGIGPTPTGGLLGDFPRGRSHQPPQPIRHPLPPGQGVPPHPDQQYGWQGQPPQEMGNWDRPPFEPQHPDRFGPRGPPRGPPGPPGPPGPMNRPFFPPPHPHGDRFGPPHPHGDRFGPPHPQGPPRGRGPGPQGHPGNWGGAPPMDNEEERHYMPNGGPSGGGGGGPPPPMDEDGPRHMMEGGYHEGGNYGWGPGPAPGQGPPNNFRGPPQFPDGPPNFRGGGGGPGPGFRGPPDAPYERGDDEFGGRGPPPQFQPNYQGQFHPGQHQQGPPGRWNQDGGRGGFNRGGGAGRRGGGRRGGYNY